MNTYHDIQMKDIEFLRNIYIAADLSIRPKTKVSRLEQLKELVRVLAMTRRKELLNEVKSAPRQLNIAV